MIVIRIVAGATLLIAGITALYLPFFTFIMGLSSFSNWDQAEFLEKLYGVYVLFAFTSFAAMPSLICLCVSIWLLRAK